MLLEFTSTLKEERDENYLNNSSDESGLSLDPTGIYSVPSSLGTHIFMFTATDNDNDRPGDSLTKTVYITIYISDDDTTPPII